MNSLATPRCSIAATALYSWLNPIPFGFFVAGLIFDILYARTAVVMWEDGADWLITLGLLFAIVPRLINLVQVWITSRRLASGVDKLDFWLNVAAIIVAIFNALVHTRDAYGIVPAGVWLSACTVILLSISYLVVAVQHAKGRGFHYA